MVRTVLLAVPGDRGISMGLRSARTQRPGGLSSRGPAAKRSLVGASAAVGPRRAITTAATLGVLACWRANPRALGQVTFSPHLTPM